MQEDNVYTRNTSTFIKPQPEEQRKEIERENVEIASSVQAIKRIVERLDERIEYFGSIISLPDDHTKISPEEFMRDSYIRKGICEILIEERNEIADLINDIATE